MIKHNSVVQIVSSGVHWFPHIQPPELHRIALPCYLLVLIPLALFLVRQICLPFGCLDR